MKQNQSRVSLPVTMLLKSDSSFEGERLVRMQVSSQEKDAENDVILQKALLNSANYYVNFGNVDIDHLTMVGYKTKLPHDPHWYEVGRPLEVNDLGDSKTEILWKCYRDPRGIFDSEKNSYDFFWQSLFLEPPAVWRASVGGPVQSAKDNVKGHRFVVEEMRWENTAVTKLPINYTIEGVARPVTTKSLLKDELDNEFNDAANATEDDDAPVTHVATKAPTSVYEIMANLTPSERESSVAELTERLGEVYKAQRGLARIYALAVVKHLQMEQRIR